MKKILLSFLFILILYIPSFAQNKYSGVSTRGNPNTVDSAQGMIASGKGIRITNYADTTAANADGKLKTYAGATIFTTVSKKFWISNGLKWTEVGSGGGSSTITGGIVTSVPVVGTVLPSNVDINTWIDSAFYASQPPLAGLTGGGTYEFTSASTVGRTLNWSATRQSATSPLSTIVVAGSNQTFSQPAQGATVSGTQGVTVTTNTTTSYSNLVTTTDGKTATATTIFSYASKYYKGYVSSSSPSDADIIAATGGSVGGVFATNYLTSGTLPDPASESFIVFAFPQSFGIPTIKVNGLNIDYNLTTRSLTNASGYSVSYYIFVSPFATNSGVEYQIF